MIRIIYIIVAVIGVLVAAYLVKYQDYTIDAALDLIKEKRPQVNINEGLLELL